MNVTVTVNGTPVSVDENATVLEAARAAYVKIPTLCYLKGVNEVGACRVCLVEVKGEDRLVAACSTRVADGMEVETMTARVRAARCESVKHLLARHDARCLECPRNGTCELQALARELGLSLEEKVTPERLAYEHWDASRPFVRNAARCLTCLRCVNVCEKGLWTLVGHGSRARVVLRPNADLASAGCAACLKCVESCPVAALCKP